MVSGPHAKHRWIFKERAMYWVRPDNSTTAYYCPSICDQPAMTVSIRNEVG